MRNLSTELKVKLDGYRKVVEIFRKNLSAQEVAQIDQSIKRLEELEIVIAAFGVTDTGKSSLLNSLLGYNNKDPNRPFRSGPQANMWNEYIESHSVVVWREITGLRVIVQDTPGIAGDFSQHQAKAMKIAQGADIVLFVTAGPIFGAAKTAMDELMSAKKPLIVAVNQCEILKDEIIEEAKKRTLQTWPSLSEMIVLTAGDPNLRVQKEPIIEELVSKIVSVVQIRQEELIWRTVEKYLSDKRDIVAQIILAQKGEDAKGIIHKSAFSAAAASAAIPAPFDEPALTTLHITMVQNLGAMFEQKLDKTAAVTIIGLVAGAIIGKTAANIAANALPPGLANAVRASVTFAHTEGLGWAAYKYFGGKYNPLS